MKKTTLLRLSLLSIALMLFSVNTALADDGDVIFHETFDDCDGTGGNDGQWSGSRSGTSYTKKTGWGGTSLYKADRCVRIGASSTKGNITTSGISFENSKSYTLILRMACWKENQSTARNVKVTVSTGKIDGGNSKTCALVEQEFNIYTMVISQSAANATVNITANVKNNNRFFLDEIMIVEGSKVNVTIASSGWSSMATPAGLDFSSATPSGLTAFVASSVSAGGVTLTSVDEAAGATGVMLKGTGGTTYSIPIKATATTTGTNKLSAAYSATPAAANALYILKSGELCLVDTGGSSVPAGKAYLLASEVPSGARDLAFIIDDEGGTTGIKSVENSKKIDGIYYDLSGRIINNPAKGLYIVNGKKVVIK